jgi:hypothetical protein
MKTRNRKPQPIVRDGKKLHPLVALSADMSMQDIGKMLGHANHTTASIYVSRARRKPTTPVPAEWCLAVAKALQVPPAVLRPDLYLPKWVI